MTNISSSQHVATAFKTTGTVHSTYVSHRHVLRPHHKIAGPTCTKKAADTGPTKLCFATHVCKISQSPSKGIGHIDAQDCGLQWQLKCINTCWGPEQINFGCVKASGHQVPLHIGRSHSSRKLRALRRKQMWVHLPAPELLKTTRGAQMPMLSTTIPRK